MKLGRKSPRLCRPCSRCDKTFQPTGKFQRVCEKCRDSKYVYTKQKLFDCPYKTLNSHCNNKFIKEKICPFKSITMCGVYNEWIKGRKSKIEPINPSKRGILER
jgi:hypothetical protein